MSENYLTKENIVLIANGKFPTHEKPLEIIKKNKYIICCDGAANSLIKFGRKPNVIIGDCDSIENDIKNDNIETIIHINNQNAIPRNNPYYSNLVCDHIHQEAVYVVFECQSVQNSSLLYSRRWIHRIDV